MSSHRLSLLFQAGICLVLLCYLISLCSFLTSAPRLSETQQRILLREEITQEREGRAEFLKPDDPIKGVWGTESTVSPLNITRPEIKESHY